MVFTIEPGLYIAPGDTSEHAKWRGNGIRTEDDVVVTNDGHRVLTDKLARSADEIEALMSS
jgi:Xaa-Pro aminopeptidase